MAREKISEENKKPLRNLKESDLTSIIVQPPKILNGLKFLQTNKIKSS